jgi:hypothetical protein
LTSKEYDANLRDGPGREPLLPESKFLTIFRLFALMVLTVLPMQAGMGQNAFPAAGTTYVAVALYLSSADEAKSCSRDDLLRAIQSDMKVSERAKRLLKPLATSRDQACDALDITSKGEVKTIKSMQARAATCGLQPRDLDLVFADHKDTIRVLYRVCSPAQIRQRGLGAYRFENFGMPPFPN